MPIELNEDRISDLVDHLQRSVLDRAPETHFPVQLPLSFPTPLHHVNLLTVLHLVHTTISQPRHTSYLAETRSDAHDLAIRGVFGLFLGSDESWGSQNLLSSKAWKQGVMDEARVGEFFGLDIMREKDHPTMPVKIGERWKPGVDLAGDLVGLLRRLGERLPLRCVGEAVLAALGHSEEDVKGQKGSVRHMTFARSFCNKVLEFERSLADTYSAPSDGAVLPAAPLRLLQDLAALLPLLPDLKIAIPKPDDLSHLSPLPLSLSLLIFLGLIDLSQSTSLGADLETLQSMVSTAQKPVDVLLSSLTSPSSGTSPSSSSSMLAVSAKTFAALQTTSVEVSRHIWGAARFSRASDAEGEWKHELSFLDVERICSELRGAMLGRGLGTVLVVRGEM